MWQKLDVNTESNRFDIVPSYALLLLLGFSKILIFPPRNPEIDIFKREGWGRKFDLPLVATGRK